MARNVLCARWEAPSRKINISERALRGKFFRNFFREYGKILKEVLRKKTFYFLRVLLLLHVDFSETHDSGSAENISATGSWITLIISQTQWQEMLLCALAERRRLEKSTSSERALRGKFFRNFFREYGKNPEGSSSKENFLFFLWVLLLSSCWFFRDARLGRSAENIFATGSNNPDNFTDPVARNVLCARWEAPSRKINISERALRGKFSFRNFFREYGKILKEVLRKENFLFFASSTALLVDFFETHDSQGAQRICHWVVNNPDNFTDPVARNVLPPSRKINISERALRGKFFRNFSVNTEKILKEVLRKKTSYFFEFYCPSCWFFRDARLAGSAENIFCHWVVNNPDNFTDPVARNVLCARWEAPSRKINISERALRGKFSFEIFSVNTEKSWRKFFWKKTSIFWVLLLLSSCWFFETHDSQGAQRIFCHWVE